jgi:hypothetical protein
MASSREMTVQSTNHQNWLEFMAQSKLPIWNATEQIAYLFAPEIRRYCELIQASGGAAQGLLVRGENASFTRRAQELMQVWKMPQQGIKRYLALAEQFEHKRAFFKLEWHQSQPSQAVDYLIAYYFRRRPAVESVLVDLQHQGVGKEILDRIAQVANLLNKESVHFVAAAMRPQQELCHKLYFSQYITADQDEVVLHRLFTLMKWFGVELTAQSFLAQCHRALLGTNPDTTIFVSISFTRDQFTPAIKIDYPQVSPAMCTAVATPAVQTEVQKFCTSVGKQNLSYLGIRFCQSGAVSFKYYVDLP